MRRGVRTLVVVLLAVAGLLVVRAHADKPNILFILVDDLGYNDLTFMGAPDLSTPNIDAIAHNGVWFSSAYSLAARCSPARSGFLTGKNPALFGHIFNPPHTHEDAKAGLPVDQTIIPETLKTAGYKTFIAGKWHLGFHWLLHPIIRGFHEFYGFLGGRFNYLNTILYVPSFNLVEYIYDRFNNPANIKHHTVQFTDETIDFVTNCHSESKPFFVYLAYNAPHGPFDNFPEDIDPNIPIVRRAYAATVNRIDIEIGRLMAHLEALGILENTLVIFTNDNGGHTKHGASNAPFRGKKGSFREGGVRIPMFMQWTGHIKPGETIDHPVTLLDMFPTFQEMAEVREDMKMKDLDGVDLMPYIAKVDGEPPREGPPHDHIVLGGDDRGMVRKGPFKLLIQHVSTNVSYLYNLENDESESNSIRRRNPEVFAELWSIFNEFYARTPEIAFGADLRTNPISVTMIPPEVPVFKNVPVVFDSSASHAEQEPLSFEWEVYRPANFHRANFKVSQAAQVNIVSDTSQEAIFTFTKQGLWTVRINAVSGDFVKWAEFNVTVLV